MIGNDILNQRRGNTDALDHDLSKILAGGRNLKSDFGGDERHGGARSNPHIPDCARVAIESGRHVNGDDPVAMAFVDPPDDGGHRFANITGESASQHRIHDYIALAKSLAGTVDAFRTFDLVRVMTDGGPAYTTETLSLYLYRTAFNFNKLSRAGAGSMIMLLVIGVISALMFRYLYRDVERR